MDYSRVQFDKQWIRRCKQEELGLIDSFSGPKADQIQKAIHVSHQAHFYPSGARMLQLKPANDLQKRQERHTHAVNRLDDGDNVSKCSAKTPMTQSDASSMYSYKSK